MEGQQQLKQPDSLLSRIKNFWLDHPLQTGIDLVDLQHIYLIYLMMDLNELTSSRVHFSQEKAQQTFSSVIDFVSEHFYLESLILTHFQYPGTRDHLREHKRFTDDLLVKAQNRASFDQDSAKELFMNLMTWLYQHIMQEDMEYASFFKEQEIEVDEYLKGLVERGEIFVSSFQRRLFQQVMGRETQLPVGSEELVHSIYHFWRTYDLSLRIPLLDIQHLWFIGIMLKLDRDARKGGDKKTRKEILESGLKKAEEYARVHFRTEEKLMEKFRYPGLLQHKRQHGHFTGHMKTKKVQSLIDAGDSGSILELSGFLKEWLLSHIAIQDRALLWYFKKNNDRIQIYSKEIIRSGEASLKRNQINLYKQIQELSNQRDSA